MAWDRYTLGRWLHFAACQGAVTATTALMFSGLGQPWMQPFYLAPSIIWSAMQFTWLGTAATVVTMLAGFALGHNPYMDRPSDPDIAGWLMMQAIVIGGGVGAVLSFVVERQRLTAVHLRDMTQTIDLGVFMARQDNGTIQIWSKGAERLYGFTAQEAMGRISHDLLQTEFPIPISEIETILVRDGYWQGDLRHTTKDGRHLIVASRKTIRRNGTRPWLLLEVLTDVTTQRADAAALAALNVTLEQRVEAAVAAREVAQARARHAQHMQALGQIAAGVAHEFNNMLQTIIGTLALIDRRADDPAAVRRFAGMALTSSERGAVITSRLLGFARRSPLVAERFDAALIMDALHDVLTHTLGGRVTIRLDLQPALPWLLVDSRELQTVLINLVTNARDAMPEGGAVTLWVGAETIRNGDGRVELAPGRYVRIAVIDRGMGMDAATLARAAEPFFTTKPVGSGTGLGLSMAKGFAEQSGGGLVVDSLPNEGTTVTMWLPAVTATGTPSDRPPLAVTSRSEATQGVRVLLVEDEDLVREALRLGLENRGLSVVAARGGAEALALLDGGAIVDVLISDFAMPEMDGLTLVERVRERRRGLPAAILTGYIDQLRPGVTITDLERGVQVLRKPMTATQLVASIENILAGSVAR